MARHGDDSRTGTAYGVIKQRILRADLLPDTVVDEKAIAAELGMSRTPVRQALGGLAAEGFIRVLPQRGTLVAPLPVSDIEQVYLLRGLVEPPAAAMAARRATPADIDQLRQREHEYLEQLTESGDRTLHTEFHVAVADLAGMPRLSKIITELQEHTQWFLSVRDREGGQMPSPHRHAELIDAIEAGNSEAASSLSRRAILSSRQKIMQGIRPDAELLVTGAWDLDASDLSG